MVILRIATSAALLLWAAPALPQAAGDGADGLLFSCEAFPRDLTEDDLRARFGAENVVRAQVVGRDDGPQETTVVFPNDASRRLYVSWLDVETGTMPGGLSVRDPESLWRNADGFSTGSDLLAIEAANGWPFRLRSLTFEGAGRVLSWGRGRLTDLDAGLPECRMTITFRLRPDSRRDPLLARQVSSLRIGELSSGHPALQELNPVIEWMVISYPIMR